MDKFYKALKVIILIAIIWIGYELRNANEILLQQSNIKIHKPRTCEVKLHDSLFARCREGIVDKHYEVYTSNRKLIKDTCLKMAREITCSEIPESAL